MNHDEIKDDFLSKFPNNAEKWSDATDNIREFARAVRLTFNNDVLRTPNDSFMVISFKFLSL